MIKNNKLRIALIVIVLIVLYNIVGNIYTKDMLMGTYLLKNINPNMPLGDFNNDDTLVLYSNGYFKSRQLGWGYYSLQNNKGLGSSRIKLTYYSYGLPGANGYIDRDLSFNIKLCFGADNYFYYQKISDDINYYKRFVVK